MSADARSIRELDDVLEDGDLSAQDLPTLLETLGVDALHAVVVDLQTRTFVASWLISKRGDGVTREPPPGWNLAAPSFVKLSEQLFDTPVGEPITRKLGIHRSLYAWRPEPGTAILAEAHYLRGRQLPPEASVELVKEIAALGIEAGEAMSAFGWRDGSEPEASASARPGEVAVRTQGAPWSHWSCIAMMLACLAIGAWMWAVAAPQVGAERVSANAEIGRLSAALDDVAVRSLALAMAQGDFGEVQDVIAIHQAAGHLTKAAVVDSGMRPVAVAGPWRGVQVGVPIVGDVAATLRKLPLRLGSGEYGSLVVPQAAAVAATVDGSPIGPASAGIALTALLAAAVLTFGIVRARKARRLPWVAP